MYTSCVKTMLLWTPNGATSPHAQKCKPGCLVFRKVSSTYAAIDTEKESTNSTTNLLALNLQTPGQCLRCSFLSPIFESFHHLLQT